MGCSGGAHRVILATSLSTTSFEKPHTNTKSQRDKALKDLQISRLTPRLRHQRPSAREL
eukprot:m.153635 g.153635  ORF g.153635 m.153635 type:complete len:59 (-) comp52867_c0_seq3:906-1082(-)